MSDPLYSLSENSSLLNGEFSFSLDVGFLDEHLKDIILNGGEFDRSKSIQLGVVDVKAGTGANLKELKFLESGSLEFGFSAEASSNLSIHFSPSSVREEISLSGYNSSTAAYTENLNFSDGEDATFVVLECGFSAQGNVNGSLPLSTVGALTVGVTAHTAGDYKVIRRFPSDASPSTILQGIANSFILPIHATELDRYFHPGTFLITGVRGGIKGNIGVKLGYDFNWIRQGASMGSLQGDLGLRLQLGLATSVGLNVSGEYVVVVSRSGDAQVVRLQLFKQSRYGHEASLSASATINAVIPDSFTPDSLTGFLKGVLGIDGPQVVKTIDNFEKIINNPDALKNILTNQVTSKLTELAVDLSETNAGDKYDKVRNQLVEALKKYNTLESSVSKILWDQIDQEGINSIRKIANNISNYGEDDLKDFINEKLRTEDFFQTPAGQYLEALLDKGIEKLFNAEDGITKLRKASDTALDILSQDYLTKRLRDLKVVLEDNLDISRLKLDNYQEALNDADFAALPSLLKDRLSNLIGEVIDSSNIEGIRQTVGKFYDKAGDFYSQTIKALRKEHTFNLQAAMSKATTATALVDLEFDMTKAQARAAYPAILGGDFVELFTAPIQGVKVNQGVLTHNIERTGSVDLTMPWGSVDKESFSESLASLEIMEEHGQIYVYGLAAKSTVLSSVYGRDIRSNVVSLQRHYAKQAGIRKFSYKRDGDGYRMSVRQGTVSDTSISRLVGILNPIVKGHFPSEFANSHAGMADSSLESWLIDLESRIDPAGQVNGVALGPIAYTLNAEINTEVMDPWLGAPINPSDYAYREMAYQLQEAYRAAVFNHYFGSFTSSNLRVIDTAAMIFCALPRLNYDVFTNVEGADGHFDFDFGGKINNPMSRVRISLRRLLREFSVHQSVTQKIREIHLMVRGQAQYGETLDYWVRHEASELCKSISPSIQEYIPLLIRNERIIIKAAIEAGIKFAEARMSASPERALQSLSQAGDLIVRAFNNKIKAVFPRVRQLQDGAELRSFSALLFNAASQGLSAPNAGVDFEQSKSLMLHFVKTDPSGKSVSDAVQNFVIKGNALALGNQWNTPEIVAKSYTSS